MEKFDPYRKWLAIAPKDQPPTHYRLLGLEPFEADPDVIEGAVDQRMGYIRQYQSGEHATEAARILNELAAARLCLLKPSAKLKYDEELRRKIESAQKPNSDTTAVLVAETRPVLRQQRAKTKSAKSGLAPDRLMIAAGAIIVVALTLIMAFKGNGQPSPSVKQPSTRAPIETPIASHTTAPTMPRRDPAPNAQRRENIADLRESKSEIVILRAEFGGGDNWIDLSERVKKGASRDQLLMMVDSSIVGGDPSFGFVKHLKLHYRVDGREWEQWFCENNVVQLGLQETLATRRGPGFLIDEAWYGGGIDGETTWVDVADQLRARMENGRIEGRVSELMQGINLPRGPGIKGLFVRYSLIDYTMTTGVEERDTLSIGDHWNLSPFDQGPENRTALSVLDARYGAKETWVDITTRAATAAASGRLFLTVNDQTFADKDPVPGVSKTLKLRIRLHGQLQERTYAERSFVYFETPQFTSPPDIPHQLQILEAWYGRGLLGEKTWVDVRDRIKVDGPTLDVSVTSIVGGLRDPAPGSKFLFVRYATGGRILTRCVHDQGRLKIEDSSPQAN